MTGNHRESGASTASSYSGHQPLAVNWMCASCGVAWPCPTRRAQLLSQYAAAPAALVMLLGSALIEASAALPDLPAGELYAQFVGWLPEVR